MKILTIAVLSFSALFFVACSKKTESGKDIDKAGQDIKNAADATGAEAKKGAEEATKKAEKAAEDAKKKLSQ